MNEKYHVIIWDTHEIYKTFDTLSAAKRCARALGLGHTGEDLSSIFTSYSPIAYVGNDAKEVIYTDRFLASEPHFPES